MLYNTQTLAHGQILAIRKQRYNIIDLFFSLVLLKNFQRSRIIKYANKYFPQNNRKSPKLIKKNILHSSIRKLIIIYFIKVKLHIKLWFNNYNVGKIEYNRSAINNPPSYTIQILLDYNKPLSGTNARTYMNIECLLKTYHVN